MAQGEIPKYEASGDGCQEPNLQRGTVLDVDLALRLLHHAEHRNEHMKPSNFSLALAVMIGLASTSLAADCAAWVAKAGASDKLHVN
jgi:hypothetical protein